MHLDWAKSKPDKFIECAKEALKNFTDVEPNDIALLCNGCSQIIHQLDCWHRAKNIGKSLTKVWLYLLSFVSHKYSL